MKADFEQNTLFPVPNTHGGRRAGSGRKKLTDPRKAHSWSCTEAEAEKISKLLNFLREKDYIIKEYIDRLNTEELTWLKYTEYDTKNGLTAEQAAEEEKLRKAYDNARNKADIDARILANFFVENK